MILDKYLKIKVPFHDRFGGEFDKRSGKNTKEFDDKLKQRKGLKDAIENVYRDYIGKPKDEKFKKSLGKAIKKTKLKLSSKEEKGLVELLYKQMTGTL